MEMRNHDWKEVLFNSSSFYQEPDGRIYLTCTHVLKCIMCGKVIGLSDQPSERIPCNLFPIMAGCPGKKEPEPKVKWEHPIKDGRSVDVETRDYPAKKQKRRKP